MIAVPADIPLTVPEVAPIVAIPVFEALQLPPLTASVNVTVVPVQTPPVVGLMMAVGAPFTVIVVVTLQPVTSV